MNETLASITRKVSKWSSTGRTGPSREGRPYNKGRRPAKGCTYKIHVNVARSALDDDIARLIRACAEVGVGHVNLSSFFVSIRWGDSNGGAFFSVSGWPGVGPETMEAVGEFILVKGKCNAVHLSFPETKNLNISPLVRGMLALDLCKDLFGRDVVTSELSLANVRLGSNGLLEELVRKGKLGTLSVYSASSPQEEDAPALQRLWHAVSDPGSNTKRFRFKDDGVWIGTDGAVALRRTRRRILSLYSLDEGPASWLSQRDGDGALGSRTLRFIHPPIPALLPDD